jgi:hypothetical protein
MRLLSLTKVLVIVGFVTIATTKAFRRQGMEEIERAHTDDTQIIRGGKIYDKKNESTFEDNLMLVS